MSGDRAVGIVSLFHSLSADDIARKILLSYRKNDHAMRPRCAQYMGALKNFQSPDYAHGFLSRNLQRALVLIDTKNVRTKFEALHPFLR